MKEITDEFAVTDRGGMTERFEEEWVVVVVCWGGGGVVE